MNMEKIRLFDFKSYRYWCVVFKLTDYCNLGCDYCYRGSNKTLRLKIMSTDIIRRVVEDYIEKARKASPKERVLYFIWHGGEPLIAGLDYFKEIISIQKDINKYGIRIINSVQTNGTLISQKWIDFFKKHNFLVGLSIDGPAPVHDINRRFKNGKSSFDATLKGMKLLKKNKYSISAISVITDKNSRYQDEMFDFFLKQGFVEVDFIPCYAYGRGLTLSNKNYARFMIKTYDLWSRIKFSKINIRFLNDLRLRVTGNPSCETAVICELAGNCGMNFSVMANGDIYPCECLNPIMRFRIGNIMKAKLEEIISSKAYAGFKNEAKKLDKKCLGCKYLFHCRGGCFNRRLSEFNQSIDYYCTARKRIIEHILQNERKAG